ncbi:hypothetical protein BX257_4723 [Streptomyces sp. 3212.3]|nr:hypothetical protein BX257_4723 [Streptomyces sp. 3212.3]
MNICAHCDEPIRDGEPYETRSIEAGSGPGGFVYLHLSCEERIAAAQPNRWPSRLGR